jgi:gliding motility-associated-like protein
VKPYIFLGDSTLLESTILTDNEYHYSWTPSIHLTNPDQSSTFTHPEETTTYTVKVTDSFGCYKKDTVTVYVTERICDEPYVFIPNAFTPNGDGNNDILYVRSDILEIFTFRIYNRLGELLFETSNVNNGWTGVYKGEKCTPGVYDYYLEGKCNNKEYILKKGNITLIR